jgi:DNA polymerase I
MTIEEAENSKDVTIGKFSVTGFQCVKSSTATITKDVQEEVLEQIVRGESNEAIVQTVHDAASSIDVSDPDWDYLGVPQGLGQKIDPKRSDEDGYYSWSSKGDHPQGEAPRAAWFANHLLDVELAKGDKPLRVKIRPGHTVKGEAVDVIAFDSSHDLPGGDFQIDIAETQRKCLENPMSNILEALEIETEAAMMGKTQEQTGLASFT